jgi:hypothetical protein
MLARTHAAAAAAAAAATLPHSATPPHRLTACVTDSTSLYSHPPSRPPHNCAAFVTHPTPPAPPPRSSHARPHGPRPRRDSEGLHVRAGRLRQRVLDSELQAALQAPHPQLPLRGSASRTGPTR